MYFINEQTALLKTQEMCSAYRSGPYKCDVFPYSDIAGICVSNTVNLEILAAKIVSRIIDTLANINFSDLYRH